MIKSELVKRIAAKNPHLHDRDIERLVNAILGTIVAALCQGDRVELRGFGVFSVKKRSARAGRNPRSGAAVAVEPKSFPFFKSSKEMHRRLNRSEARTANSINDDAHGLRSQAAAAKTLRDLPVGDDGWQD